MTNVKDIVKRTRMLQEQLYRQGIIDGIEEIQKFMEDDSNFDRKKIAQKCRDVITEINMKQDDVMPEDYADKGMSQDGYEALLSSMNMFAKSDDIDDSDDEKLSEKIAKKLMEGLPNDDILTPEDTEEE